MSSGISFTAVSENDWVVAVLAPLPSETLYVRSTFPLKSAGAESVTVTTPYLTIRGEDRNRVILDGEFMLENGIQIYDTNGVSVENLTVRNFSLNGVYWNGSLGYLSLIHI